MLLLLITLLFPSLDEALKVPRVVFPFQVSVRVYARDGVELGERNQRAHFRFVAIWMFIY